MSVASSSPVERVILHGVTWGLYERLLSEVGESPAMRVTFDNGLLQIMVVSAGRDNPNRTLGEIVVAICEETDADYCPAGSTTFKRPDLLKGFEPDSSFYFQHAATVRPKDEIDLPVDPPPELVIEVDVTRDSLNRLPIFAAVGVAEVWRYANGVVSMFALRGGSYEPIVRSLALPVLEARAATEFVEKSRTMRRPAWLAMIREYVRRARSTPSR